MATGQQQDSSKVALALVEALAPERAEAVRTALGLAPGRRVTGESQVYFTEEERETTPPELLRLAEDACPVWSRLGPPRDGVLARPFSAKRWREAVRKSIRVPSILREANASTALAFLMRKGIQILANDWYLAVPREWQDYALAAPSDTIAEWYGPLYGSVLAGFVGRSGRFPEGRVIGVDSVLVNRKAGLIESFERELFDDDQTGQIRNRASRLGQSMAITENVYAALRFIGAAASYANISVPVSNTTLTRVDNTVASSPWDTTVYATTGTTYGNRPTTYGQLSLTLLKQAYSTLLNAKDPLQNKIIVNPNTLLVSPQDALHAPMLVAPPAGVPYYPAVIGAGTTTASTAASGYPGGVFGANPFMGMGWKVVVARFLPDWAWALGEGKKGFIFQERDPLEVIQEDVAAGAAFETDTFRFRSRRRFEADWVGEGSRFWFLGADGTVTGSF